MEKKKYKDNSKKRINIYLIIVCMLFLSLFVRLIDVIMVNGKKYTKMLGQLTYKTVEVQNAPRGRIYDRNYNILVDNKAVKSIYYQKKGNITDKEEIELAYKVANNIELDLNKLTDDMKRDFYAVKYEEECEKRITDEEKKMLEERKITSKDYIKLKKNKIKDEELKGLSVIDNKVAYLYYLMNNGYTYADKLIKGDNVSEEEYAYITENIDDLGGFKTKLDWERVYPYGDSFKSILGTVSSSSQGIPSEDAKEYLKLGYALDDRVGISYIEKQYEKYLKSTKDKYEVVNRHELELVEQGKRGNDIVLTIDINLQREIEQILSEEVVKAKSEANTKYYDHSFVMIQDPNTGEVLAMSGKKAEKINGEWVAVDYTPAILTSPMTPGSVVKAASMLVGYNTGAIKIGDYMMDECIKISSTPKKCSWRNLGYINDIDALALSSNVYQFKTAIKVAGSNYQYNMPFRINNNAFELYRNMYHSFGLGVKTEIDLPVESLGYGATKDTRAGNLLDFVIGQYETYTPIQLSQYVTTIANGGTRYKTNLLKEVRKSTSNEELGKVIYTYKPKVLNKIDTKPEYMKRVQEGFYAVINAPGGYGRGYIDPSYSPAGKTGTSQSFIDTDNNGIIDKETITTSFVGYAPSDNPQMSIIVTSPNSSLPNTSSNYSSLVTMRITKKVTDAYFSLNK